MGLKIRIAIMRPEHTNDIFVLKRKMLEGKKFTRGNNTYFIDDDHFQITTDRPWFYLWLFARYYTTYYYVQGKSLPLPVPSFEGLFEEGDETDPVKMRGLINSEELAAIFNAWFYRTIAAPVRDIWAQLHFYTSVATLLGVVYIAWSLHEKKGA